MKKVLFLAASLFAAAYANAQEEATQPASADVKPDEGTFSLEVGFCPFQSNSVSLQNGRLMGIYSINENWSVRAGLGFEATSDTDANDVESESRTISFTPGAFYSFEGTDKMTPYLGGELGFYSTKAETDGKTTKDILGIGIAAFTGMNYYFSKNIYVGVEVGAGFYHEKDDKNDESGNEFKIYAQPSVRLGWAF